MAYTHNIERYEKYRDQNGKIVSIYLLVNSTDGTSEIRQEINLNKVEREVVINNPEAIKEVIVRYIADIEEKLDQETANNPYPPIIASEEERMAILSFSRTDIKNQKDKFKKERTDNPGINVVVDASL